MYWGWGGDSTSVHGFAVFILNQGAFFGQILENLRNGAKRRLEGVEKIDIKNKAVQLPWGRYNNRAKRRWGTPKRKLWPWSPQKRLHYGPKHRS
jgi:hypothetical protein